VDFQIVSTGYGLLESPRADARNVWFTDMALGGIHHLASNGEGHHWLPERRMIGGLAMNADGAILCSGTGGVIWFDPVTGRHGSLLDSIQGKPISGINDVTPDGRGGLLFGTVDHERMFRGESYFGRSAIYRLTVQGEVARLCTDVGFANGLGLSPDHRWLYFNNSGVGTFACEQLDDGFLGPLRQIGDRADCDGLAVDTEGGIWIACISAGVIVRLDCAGREDRVIAIKGSPTSLCFGGPDGRDLYVTTAAPGAGAAIVKRHAPPQSTAALLRGRLDVTGTALLQTAFNLSG
jgi:sugar lactone lactonase YvrE